MQKHHLKLIETINTINLEMNQNINNIVINMLMKIIKTNKE
jgi:hypothetical protein